MKVDFHVHSTASDGTFSPDDLANMAKGFSAFALTDHDNMDGVSECREACAALGVPFVGGVELSIEPGRGFDKFHLLALGVDLGSEALKVLLGRILEGRNGRNERIIENFRRKGIAMDDTIYAYAHGEVLARPHFARWLMDHGYVASVKEGFDRYLLPESPEETRCYEDRWHPGQEETFRAVHEAGGLCVMAHPKYWRRYWKYGEPEFADAERGLAELKEKGLDGLEAVYQANSALETVEFTRIARKLGLLVSAGSDFHGSNKPTIPLGMDVDGGIVAPLLERLNLV